MRLNPNVKAGRRVLRALRGVPEVPLQGSDTVEVCLYCDKSYRSYLDAPAVLAAIGKVATLEPGRPGDRNSTVTAWANVFVDGVKAGSVYLPGSAAALLDPGLVALVEAKAAYHRATEAAAVEYKRAIAPALAELARANEAAKAEYRLTCPEF
jgi:hypothetical protein